MTRRKAQRKVAARKASNKVHGSPWPLQDAKARFSELVRLVKSEGPQLVTVHGREEVVVVSAREFRRLRGDRTGQALVELMRTSPLRDVDFGRGDGHFPVRHVDL